MTRPTPRPSSTQLRVPVTDDSIESLRIENALLMRRNLFLLHADIKLRAALELATGVPWDTENLTDLHGEKLQDHVARNFAHGMGCTIKEAKERINKHRKLANPSQIETPQSSLSANPSVRALNRDVPTIDGKPAI
jgi:hypothetical protein